MMRGMILAAGYGTRMGPISRYLAKPAIPFLGVPMIEHSIAVLRSGGIREIVINLHHLPRTITDLLGDGSRLGVDIEYSYEDPILGSGGGIGKARDFLDGDTFVVLNSDVKIDTDLQKVIEAHRQREADATLLLREDSENMYGKLVVDETDTIRKIEGFPEELSFHGGKPYMFCGLHIIEPVWFDYTPDTDVYESFPHVYGPMIKDGCQIYGHVYDGRWIDLGTAEKLLEATLDQLVGNLIPNVCKVPESSRVSNSVLTTQTSVGSNTALNGMVCLGPAVIGNNCTIENAICCPGAEISDGTEANSVIFHEQTFTSFSTLNRQ